MAGTTDTPTDRRAAIYTRISRDAVGDGEGVDRQEELCRALAERLGLEVHADRIFEDNDMGASDRTNKRKIRTGYIGLLEGARAGDFGHILAYSNSRLTRRMLELEDLIKLHEETKVVIRTVVSGDDDLSTASGRMTARIKASVDAAESEFNSERSVTAHVSKAAKGVHKRSPWRAFGFMDDGITHHPKEARLIQDAVARVIEGSSIRQIGKMWEEQGITSTRGTTYWGHSRLKDALFSLKVAGIRPYKGKADFDAEKELVKGEWEPIISLEDRTRALLELETHYAKPKRREGRWLLSGLLRCGKCGRPMYGNHGGDTRPSNYICSNGRSAHLGINAAKLEDYLERVVHRYELDKSIFGVDESESIEPEPWPHEDRLSSVAAKIEELLAAFNSNALPGGIVFPQIDKLDSERRQLENDHTNYNLANKPRPRTVLTKEEAWKLYRGLKEQFFEDRRLTLKREIETVVIQPGKQGSRSYQDFKARVKIGWLEPHQEFNGRSAEDAADELMINLPLEWSTERPPGQKYERRTPEYIAAYKRRQPEYIAEQERLQLVKRAESRARAKAKREQLGKK